MPGLAGQSPDYRGVKIVTGRPGTSTQEPDRIRELEREVRELRQVNEILRKASAYFAQAELDR